MERLKEAQKALTALGSAVVAVAALTGFVIDSDTVALVAAAVAPVLVYFIPNE